MLRDASRVKNLLIESPEVVCFRKTVPCDKSGYFVTHYQNMRRNGVNGAAILLLDCIRAAKETGSSDLHGQPSEVYGTWRILKSTTERFNLTLLPTVCLLVGIEANFDELGENRDVLDLIRYVRNECLSNLRVPAYDTCYCFRSLKTWSAF